MRPEPACALPFDFLLLEALTSLFEFFFLVAFEFGPATDGVTVFESAAAATSPDKDTKQTTDQRIRNTRLFDFLRSVWPVLLKSLISL